MLTPNGAAMFVAILAIPNADPRILTMAVMWMVWSIAIAAVAARIFGKQAEKTVAGNTT
jgi:hypothetical protein